MKILILLASFIAVVHQTQCAALRRKPKVYNALITTDQNLTPSRAYPIIQPHLQETYAYPSFSYRSSYAPLGVYNRGFQYGSAVAPSSIASYNGFHSYPRGIVEARNYFPRDEISTIPPIPLNNFGLPPSIVPLNSFGFGHSSHLAPYPYNSYPLIYDQYGGYGSSNPYLPPFSFYPSELEVSSSGAGKRNGKPNDGDASVNDGNSGGNSGSGGAVGSNGSASSGGSSGGGSGNGEGSGTSGGGSGTSGGGSGTNGGGSGTSGGSSNSVSSSSSSSTKTSRARNFDKPEQHHQLLNENIKNFANKDPSIPDVPPPPLPSGAKKATDK